MEDENQQDDAMGEGLPLLDNRLESTCAVSENVDDKNQHDGQQEELPLLDNHRKTSDIIKKVIKTLLVLAALGLQIVYVVLGSIYLHDCPRAPAFPILAIVLGILHFLYIITLMTRDELGDDPFLFYLWGGINFTVMAALMGVILHARTPDFVNPNSQNFCHPNLYYPVSLPTIVTLVFVFIYIYFDNKVEMNSHEHVHLYHF